MADACIRSASAIISDAHRNHGRESAVKACDDLIAGALFMRRMLCGFQNTAEYLDQLAHHDAEVLARAKARAAGLGFTEEKKRGTA